MKKITLCLLFNGLVVILLYKIKTIFKHFNFRFVLTRDMITNNSKIHDPNPNPKGKTLFKRAPNLQIPFGFGLYQN